MNTNASSRGRALGAFTGLCVMAAILSSDSRAAAQCEPRFVRGDSNADGALDISDGIATLLALFLGGPQPACLDAADADDSGGLDMEDPIGTFAHLFGGGPGLPIPSGCGVDPTGDALGCDAFAPCASGSSTEVCDNGVDDDCDGASDSEDLDCGCQPGLVRICGTTDTGECSTGFQTCEPGGRWGPCDGAVEPVNETCDFLDNDCEGTADNGFDEDEDGWTPCAGDCNDEDPQVSPSAGTDRIDGIDNDCDMEIDEGPFATSHAATIQPIWTANCTAAACHDATSPQAGIDLTPAAAYGEIVDKRSSQARSLDLVEPLDPSRSYLWHKLLNTQRSAGGSGSSMPSGRPQLTEASLRVIEQWILEGAPR